MRGYSEQENETALMDTRKIKDKLERKKLKRAARRKRPPKAKRTDPRGSHKPKVKKKAPAGQARR